MLNRAGLLLLGTVPILVGCSREPEAGIGESHEESPPFAQAGLSQHQVPRVPAQLEPGHPLPPPARRPRRQARRCPRSWEPSRRSNCTEPGQRPVGTLPRCRNLGRARGRDDPNVLSRQRRTMFIACGGLDERLPGSRHKGGETPNCKPAPKAAWKLGMATLLAPAIQFRWRQARVLRQILSQNPLRRACPFPLARHRGLPCQSRSQNVPLTRRSSSPAELAGDERCSPIWFRRAAGRPVLVSCQNTTTAKGPSRMNRPSRPTLLPP